MSSDPKALDLIVLAADKHIATSVETLLHERRADLGIRAVSFDVRRHPQSDPGCRSGAAEFLRPLNRVYRYALVVFDYEGCGSQDAPEKIRREVESALERNGWRERSKAIVIVPELEAWVWTPSGEVARSRDSNPALGHQVNLVELFLLIAAFFPYFETVIRWSLLTLLHTPMHTASHLQILV